MDELYDDLIKLIVSIALGSLLGIEREFKNKAAGFRTIVLICLGATVFTIISFRTAQSISHDRIAANIITGIGFIGAGVIFKEGLSVSGLTTAAIIWVAASLGMAIGRGDFILASAVSAITIFIQTAFNRFENWLETIHHRRRFRITFAGNSMQAQKEIESYLLQTGIRYKWEGFARRENRAEALIDVRGSLEKVKAFSGFLSANEQIYTFF